MRGLRRAALLLGLVVLPPAWATAPALAGAPGGAHREGGAPIRIAAFGWGDTETQDLQVVLDAVAAELGRHFPDRRLDPIRVVPAPDHPMVRYERGAHGEYVVELSARDGRWYQFAYQFGHELCHIYSNYGNKPAVDGAVVARNQWFEESLCEAAALFTLDRLAARWRAAPPAARWRGYDATFARYAARLASEPHRRLPARLSFVSWFHANARTLEASPYLRDKDEVVSTLLLPLFAADPDGWGAIGYLNARQGDAALAFGDYLAAWYEACPPRYRALVGRIIGLFDAGAPVAQARIS
jgi:hypothetical protein